MPESAPFIDAIRQSLANGTFVRLSLSKYRGSESGLIKIMARRITVKRAEKLSFTYRYATRDIVKNYAFEDALTLLGKLLSQDFSAGALMTTDFDLEWPRMRQSRPSQKEAPEPTHDRAKARKVATDARPYLHKLGITDNNGGVIAAAQDKYRQIDKYIDIVGGLVDRMPSGAITRIADMGAGKGYLTFALYDYLATTRGQDIEMTGVEMRPDLVVAGNRLAKDAGFDRLRFAEGTIGSFDAAGTDLLIALHACDTATDDAIAKGLSAGAKLIVVAPCCHKQIRREMERGAPSADLDFMLRHGTLLERQAEMVTDAMRALILEYFGYGVKVFEFISDAHTPKNVMIVAEKKNSGGDPAILAKLEAAKTLFGIGRHYLETAAGLQPRQ